MENDKARNEMAHIQILFSVGVQTKGFMEKICGGGKTGMGPR